MLAKLKRAQILDGVEEGETCFDDSKGGGGKFFFLLMQVSAFVSQNECLSSAFVSFFFPGSLKINNKSINHARVDDENNAGGGGGVFFSFFCSEEEFFFRRYYTHREEKKKKTTTTRNFFGVFFA